MKSKMLLFLALLFACVVFPSSCGTASNCPVCGTTVNDGYGIIDIIPVPEHNPTGAPGGPFNSFDISVTDSVHHRFYVSDRIGLDVAVFDTIQNLAIGIITGDNGVAGAGDNPSVCAVDAAGNPLIPPIVSGLGNFTRFGCRTDVPGATHTWSSAKPPGFGPSGHLGGFPGAQCCASRANGVNPVSAPDGEVLSPENTVLFVGNGSSSVVAFDLTCGGAPCTQTNVPGVLAAFPTGASPDYDGCIFGQTCLPGSTPNTAGIAPCIASSAGRALSDPTCGDMRADEMAIGVINGRTILLAANGDPGLPFVTLIDVTNIISRTGTASQQHCLPGNFPKEPYYPAGIAGSPFPTGNFPTCIIGQIYYDGAGSNDVGVPIDAPPPAGGNFSPAALPCPDPSTTVPSGVSGTGGGNSASCHHGPILNPDGSYCSSQVPPPGTCFGAVALTGIGGSAFNPNTGHFLVTNGNASPTDLTVGTVDEIDPRLGNPNGPVVVNTFPVPNCMPTSIVQGPGNNFLVGCADHDGVAFPPNEYVIDGTSGKIIATIDKIGGVDEIWYNPGDNRYYLAARDMPTGPMLGIIDAKTNQWLQNVPTNANSHSVAVDSGNNHVFVPLQAGPRCTTQSANGCIGVYAQQ
jgi:hypothetical protein